MPEHSRYPIPGAETRVEIRVSNSRFIASAGHAPTVEAAKDFIARVRAEFADATHNVYAFVVGFGGTTTLGMSDDGEPGGTAGRPALAVLSGSGLGDVVVVVTRYFGGTLLGTGGLVRAYGDAVRAVLAELPRAERVERQRLSVRVPYALYEQTRRLILTGEAEIVGEEFAADVALLVVLPQTDADGLSAELTELTAGQAIIREDDAPARESP